MSSHSYSINFQLFSAFLCGCNDVRVQVSGSAVDLIYISGIAGVRVEIKLYGAKQICS
jgi:hypothetical protein